MSGAPDLLERLQVEVERARERNIKGWNYLVSSGPPRGVTPKDVVLNRGTLSLYHYRPQVSEVYRTPILFVMATTNRGYIFDLAPGQSFVEFLLKRGYDVYVIDWNPPRDDECRLRFEDYVLDFIPSCVAEVQERSGEREVSLVGYCMGGVLALIHAALHADGPVRNLACFTTPFDWSKYGLFNRWADPRHFDVDTIVDTFGNLPADLISTSFEMLRPVSKAVGQVQVWDNMWNDEFVKSYRAFDRWGAETLPLAGEYFRQIVKELFFANKLYTGELEIGGRRVDVGAIKVPFLHAIAEHDHIAPFEATRELIERVGSTDKEQLVLKGGHVSLIAGPNAVRRLWPRLDAWLAPRSA
ncbi:PHA/PHB synthase family protein [Phenylobacterium sp.]|uniref:PHA/PHB synthase family protein n=1 Tax=Phenylobacterium sp. TaxID=1871053 RepID=UPI002F925886